MHMIATRFPEPGTILCQKLETGYPFGVLPGVKRRYKKPEGSAVLAREGKPVPFPDQHRVVGEQGLEREIRRKLCGAVGHDESSRRGQLDVRCLQDVAHQRSAPLGPQHRPSSHTMEVGRQGRVLHGHELLPCHLGGLPHLAPEPEREAVHIHRRYLLGRQGRERCCDCLVRRNPWPIGSRRKLRSTLTFTTEHFQTSYVRTPAPVQQQETPWQG